MKTSEKLKKLIESIPMRIIHWDSTIEIYKEVVSLEAKIESLKRERNEISIIQ